LKKVTISFNIIGMSLQNLLNINITRKLNKPILLVYTMFLCLFFCLSGCLSPSGPVGGVEGYIGEENFPDSEVVPLENALISISGSNSTSLTDVDGYFRIDDVPIGSRKLTISKKNYYTYKIDNLIIVENENTMVNNGQFVVLEARHDKILFETGIEYYNNENYIEAFSCFEQLTADYPNSDYVDAAYFYIGNTLFQLKNYINSILVYLELIQRHPDSEYCDNAQLKIGDCYYATGDYIGAIYQYQKVIDNYPSSDLHINAFYGIATSYRKRGNYSQAINYYERIISNYSGTLLPLSQYYIGYSYYQMEDYSQAINNFQKTVDLYPTSIWLDGKNRMIAPCAQYYIAWCHENIGNWELAIEAYQIVIEEYPNDTWNDGRLISEDAQQRIDWIEQEYGSQY
jgi:TolA-binding protein